MDQSDGNLASIGGVPDYQSLFREPIVGLTVWTCRILLSVGIVAIVCLSLGPNDQAAALAWLPWDKAQHHLAYLLLCFVALIAFANLPSLAVGFCVFALGAALELIQPAFGRTQSVFDLIANLTGVATVLAVICLADVRKRLRAFEKKNAARS